ncbi:MAG: immunoglobulin domain-containing protein [Rubrivivax sp.]|nr:immunoglobulin domain-containing protein [Rubrivivax sp.]
MRTRLALLLCLTVCVGGVVSCGGGGGSSGAAGTGSTDAATPPVPSPAIAAPRVSLPPLGRAVATGKSVRFEVQAVGAGPFGYQWQRAGVAIVGATGSSYTLPAATLADDGVRFGVTVSNSGGSAPVVDALLTVFRTPEVASDCTPGGPDFVVVRDSFVSIGKAGGLLLLGCTGNVTDVNWTQTAGAALPLLSARTQAISLEPELSGSYAFNVSFRVAGGALRNQPVQIDSLPAIYSDGTRIVTRSAQAVREGQRASIRAWPTAALGDSVASVTWAQVEGPAVELDTGDPDRIIFTAPEVPRDTVLRFGATLRTARGLIDRTQVLVVVENMPAAPAGQLFGDAAATRVQPYRLMSPHATNLARCVFDPALFFNNGNTNLCTLGTLPLLAQQTAGAVPTVAQVMDRVLVSHDWMGARFEQFLLTQDASGDFRRLLGSVTSIVIGAHVRPSFYWAATGAIYLDADNLWLSPAERDSVSEVPDYRAGFGGELDYTGLWRYVVNN